MDRFRVRRHVQIFATDIDDSAIKKARIGLYPAGIREAKLYMKVGSSEPLSDGRDIPMVPAWVPLANCAKEPDFKVDQKSHLHEIVSNVLFEILGSAGVIVDNRHRILYAWGDTTPYLRISGEATLELLGTAAETVRGHLENALNQATEKDSIVRVQGGCVISGGEIEIVDIFVKPLKCLVEQEDRTLVVFQPRMAHAVEKKDPPHQLIPSRERDEIDRMQKELKATRKRLELTCEAMRSSSEELRSANEELQSYNEELQSTNEELRTAREEQQSINEELITVNSELNRKIEELSRERDDMANLFDNTQIATIFLDRDLNVTRATPPIKTLVPPQLHGDADLFLQRCISGEKVTNVTSLRITKSGREIPILLSLSLLSGQDEIPTAVATIAKDLTRQKHAEQQLLKSLSENQFLLREVHHRVKNNFQQVLSLLNLQSRHIRDQASLNLLAQMEHRIRAMAVAYGELYRSDNLAELQMDVYIATLLKHIQGESNLGQSIEISCDIEAIVLPVETALPTVFLVTELVTNSVKHAFPGLGKGEIQVSLRHAGKTQLELTVRDNGIGFPDGLSPANSDSFGLELVSVFSRQLAATLEIRCQNGSEVVITFPRSWNEPSEGSS